MIRVYTLQAVQFARTLLWIALALAGLASLAQAEEGGGWRPGALVRKLDIPSGVPWKQGKKTAKAGVPVRVVDSWTDTVLQQPGKGAERGFGGRLYFYDARSNVPIRVAGQLVVYAFDETGRKPTDNQPSRRYVFPPDQFKLHESENDLGPSYSVWLPWDAVGGVQTEVSLIVRFEPERGGSLIAGEQSRLRLPGSVPPAPQLELAPLGVMQAGYASSKAEETPEKRMQTTTINLPNGYRLPGNRPVLPSKSGGTASAKENATSLPAEAPPQRMEPASTGASTPLGASLEATMPAPAGPPAGLELGRLSTRVTYLQAGAPVQALRPRHATGSAPASRPAPEPRSFPQAAGR